MPNRPVPRGAIRHPDTYRQMLDFSGLQFERKITPMDIDLCVEFGGRYLILGEFKGPGGRVRYGQRRALTTLAIAAQKGGMEVLGFIARHDCKPIELIHAHECQVTEILLPKASLTWRPPKGSDRLVGELINSWRQWSEG